MPCVRGGDGTITDIGTNTAPGDEGEGAELKTNEAWKVREKVSVSGWLAKVPLNVCAKAKVQVVP